MNIEDIATPTSRPSPEARYASLHRAIEAGLATDSTWADLCKTCLSLHREEEACHAFRKVRDLAARRRLLVYLQKRDLLLDVDPAEVQPLGSAGNPAKLQTTTLGEITVGDLFTDAVRYLFVDQMALAVIVSTVLFPIVVGVGGALTSASGSTVLMPLIALIPTLSIVGLVGALSRRVLLDSAEGLDDPPAIPTLNELGREAPRFIADCGLITLIFLGPSALLALLGGVNILAVVATLALGLLLLPMAMTQRQIENSWSSIKPKELFRAVRKGGPRYLGTAGIAAAVFAPAILSAWGTLGSQIYLTLAVIGPMAVAPLFIATRMMGRVVFLQRQCERRTQRQTAPVQSAEPAESRRRRMPLRGTPRHPETENHIARRTAPTPAPIPQVVGEAAPDLTQMPGFQVLRGAERQSAGAAAVTRRR